MNAAAAPSARASRRPSIDAQSGLTCRVLGPHRCWHQQQPDLCQETVGLVGRAACCSDGERRQRKTKIAGRDATPCECMWVCLCWARVEEFRPTKTSRRCAELFLNTYECQNPNRGRLLAQDNQSLGSALKASPMTQLLKDILPVASDWQSLTLPPPPPLLDQPPGLVCDGTPHKSDSFIISPQMQPQLPEDQLDAHDKLTIVFKKVEQLEMECRMLKHAHKIMNDWLKQFWESSFAMQSQNGTCAGEFGNQSVRLLVTEFAERAQQMLETQSAASAAADRARKAASEAKLSAMAAMKAKVDATQQAESALASAEVLQTSAFRSVNSDVHQHHYQQRHHPSGRSSTEEAPFQ
jgi:hypothetical protein